MKISTLRNAIEKYGTDTQQDMVIEEALELALGILKHRRSIKEEAPEWYIKRWRDNIVEERADTEIMLRQVDIMFDCEEEAKEQIDYKINRLEERMRGNE